MIPQIVLHNWHIPGIFSTSLYLFRSGQFRFACGPGNWHTPGIDPNDPSL